MPYSSAEILHRIQRYTGMDEIQIAQNQKSPKERAMALGKESRHDDSLLSSQSGELQYHSKVAGKFKEITKRAKINVGKSEMRNGTGRRKAHGVTGSATIGLCLTFG
jgi:hypothetical protein